MLSVNIEKTPFYRMGIEDGIEKGIQEGIEKGIEKVAIAMLKSNIDIETIQKTTGLSLEKIEVLKMAI